MWCKAARLRADCGEKGQNSCHWSFQIRPSQKRKGETTCAIEPLYLDDIGKDFDRDPAGDGDVYFGDDDRLRRDRRGHAPEGILPRTVDPHSGIY